MTLKILNLYAGIGGNRKLWSGDIEVTAIEIDKDIAKIYQDFFPNDKVIVTDAHQYLLEHYNEFDFIWSSPPCPSHSRLRKANQIQNKPIFPSMQLYEEIIFLSHYFKGKWVVENVISYYEPLIKPQEIGRHYYWSNFKIDFKPSKKQIITISKEGILDNHETRSKSLGIKITNWHNYRGRKKLLYNNCVEPSDGLAIFNCAFKVKQEVLAI